MERRKHPRIPLKAFGMHHVCILRELPFAVDERTRASLEILLIDISPGGARFQCKNPSIINRLHTGAALAIDHRLPSSNRLPDALTGIVRWKEPTEFGIQFSTELDMGVSELQRLLDP